MKLIITINSKIFNFSITFYYIDKNSKRRTKLLTSFYYLEFIQNFKFIIVFIFNKFTC